MPTERQANKAVSAPSASLLEEAEDSQTPMDEPEGPEDRDLSPPETRPITEVTENMEGSIQVDAADTVVLLLDLQPLGWTPQASIHGLPLQRRPDLQTQVSVEMEEQLVAMLRHQEAEAAAVDPERELMWPEEMERMEEFA